MENSSNQYRVKDLNLAAYLYSEGIDLLRVDREERICWFVYENTQNLQNLVNNYWTGKTPVKNFVDAIRTLKDLIYAEN